MCFLHVIISLSLDQILYFQLRYDHFCSPDSLLNISLLHHMSSSITLLILSLLLSHLPLCAMQSARKSTGCFWSEAAIRKMTTSLFYFHVTCHNMCPGSFIFSLNLTKKKNTFILLGKSDFVRYNDRCLWGHCVHHRLNMTTLKII